MQNKNTKSYSILSIKVSRTNEKGPLASEQMFANLHGILKKVVGKQESVHDQECYSFEIANIHNNIYFLAHLPSYLRDFFESQVYAQYPDVEISEMNDYMEFRQYPSIAVCELDFLKHDILPINTYTLFEDALAKQLIDPLSSVAEALRKGVSSLDEHIGLQIICKPINTKALQSKTFGSLKRLQAGKKIFFFGNEKKLYHEAPLPMRVLLSPLSFIAKKKSKSTLDAFAGHAGSDKPEGDQKTNMSSDVGKLFINALLGKSSKLGFRVVIRVAYWADKVLPQEVLDQKVLSVANSFKQFNNVYLNGFDLHLSNSLESLALFKTRQFGKNQGMFMNTEEIASLYHLPNLEMKTPNIVWVTSRKKEPPVNLPTFSNTPESELTILGKANFRGSDTTFGVKPDDRRRHVYIIGKTGMGKSVLMENMIFSDLVNGRGVGVVDPHGELADNVIDFIPEYRKDDVIIIDPSDAEFPVAINMLENVATGEGRSLIASALVGIFKKLFGESWGPRLEYVLRNTILALVEAPDTNMMGIMRMLVDEEYRRNILSYVTDPVVLSYWNTEFANYQPKNIAEIISPIQNKVGQFLSSPIIRNIVGQTVNTINIREAMDSKKIVIVNLSKGKIGEDNSALLGSMLVTRFQLDAMSRANIDKDERVDFYLYVDEFQNFATDSFATILSEARKYKLNLTMANQYIAQMSEIVEGAVFGNVGTMVCFQVGNDDAEVFEKQFGELVLATDIISMEKYTAYMRLLVDGMPSPVFSVATLPPPDIQIDPNHKASLMNLSRQKYSQDRKKVEEKINEWTTAQKQMEAEKKPKGEPSMNINELQVGQIVKTNVIGITDYGLFLSYQGIEGLLHVNKIPDNQKKLLKEAKKGDVLEVSILEKKADQNKLAFTLLSVEQAQKLEAVIAEQQTEKKGD